jgi:hypothetical protein
MSIRSGFIGAPFAAARAHGAAANPTRAAADRAMTRRRSARMRGVVEERRGRVNRGTRGYAHHAGAGAADDARYAAAWMP